MTALNSVTPNMPRFETVNVPPESSGGVTALARTRSASARVSRAISPSDFLSASNTVGTTSASCGGDGDADVDARVELEAAVLVGAVGARVLAQRERRRLDDHVVVGRHRAAHGLGRGLELLAQLDRALHVDVGGDRELGHRGLGLRHPPRDDLLGARELLDADVALGGAGLGDARRAAAAPRRPERPAARPRAPRGAAGGRGRGAARGLRRGAPDAAASTSAFTIRPPGPAALQRGEVDALLARDAPRDGRGLGAAAVALRRAAPVAAPRRGRGLRRRRGRLGRGGRSGAGRRLARRRRCPTPRPAASPRPARCRRPAPRRRRRCGR